MAQDTIAVHWEVAAPREPHGRCAGQWEEIRAYHRRTGYSDIAYSFGACQHGQIFSGRGWQTQSAATCNGHWNARAWSVCWMGGPGFTPSAEALRAIRSVVDEARSRGATNVIGHREACATQCPGDFLQDWVNRGLPVSGAPVPTPEPPPQRKDQSMAATYFEDAPVIFEVTPDGALRHSYLASGRWQATNLFPAKHCKTGPDARVSVAVHPSGDRYFVEALAASGWHSHIATRERGKSWQKGNDA